MVPCAAILPVTLAVKNHSRSRGAARWMFTWAFVSEPGEIGFDLCRFCRSFFTDNLKNGKYNGGRNIFSFVNQNWDFVKTENPRISWVARWMTFLTPSYHNYSSILQIHIFKQQIWIFTNFRPPLSRNMQTYLRTKIANHLPKNKPTPMWKVLKITLANQQKLRTSCKTSRPRIWSNFDK